MDRSNQPCSMPPPTTVDVEQLPDASEKPDELAKMFTTAFREEGNPSSDAGGHPRWISTSDGLS